MGEKIFHDPAPTTFEALPRVVVAVLRHPARIDPAPLTKTEREIFDAFPADRDKRRREWCSGRAAAHSALEACCAAGDLSVLRDPEGRPVAEGAHVAITHGRSLAAAAASLDRHVGIDVVDPADRARLERIAERVLRGAEPEIAREHPQDGLRLIWGAREAIAKATHTGMFVFALTKVQVTAIDRDARRIATDRPGIELCWVELPDREILVIAAATDEAVRAAGREANP